MIARRGTKPLPTSGVFPWLLQHSLLAKLQGKETWMLDNVRLPEASTGDQGEIDDDPLRLAEGYDALPIRHVIAHQSSVGGTAGPPKLDHEVCKRAGGSDLSSLAAFGGIEALHHASLIDDDLIYGRPSRRDTPAIEAEYGAAAEIAAGDHLISVSYASHFAARVLEPGQCLDAADWAVSAKIRGQCADLAVGFSRAAQEYGAEPVLITQSVQQLADIADFFAAYSWIAALKSRPLLSLGTELAMAGRGMAKAANRTVLASSNLAIVCQMLDHCADLSDDHPSGRPAGNLCPLLKEIGDVTPVEAMETALMHAVHALGRAANEAVGIPDVIGIPTARLCLCKPREMKALLDAV